MWGIHRASAADGPGRMLGGCVTPADVDEARANATR
jgi:hypothetical protein